MLAIGLKVPHGVVARTIDEAIRLSEQVGFP